MPRLVQDSRILEGLASNPQPSAAANSTVMSVAVAFKIAGSPPWRAGHGADPRSGEAARLWSNREHSGAGARNKKGSGVAPYHGQGPTGARRWVYSQRLPPVSGLLLLSPSNSSFHPPNQSIVPPESFIAHSLVLTFAYTPQQSK